MVSLLWVCSTITALQQPINYSIPLYVDAYGLLSTKYQYNPLQLNVGTFASVWYIVIIHKYTKNLEFSTRVGTTTHQ